MYEEFFGLTEKPFSIQPDPSFLYWGRAHRLAYAMLEYGVLNRAGISVITGEVGCGKTTLVHRLLDSLDETHTVALLSNIQSGRGDLLSWVLMGFGQPFGGKTHVEMFSHLQHFFIDEYAKGRRVILIIDEAQNLSADMLEELRMLSNINAGKDQLLQLILVGQPQLKELLNRPDMLQLAQRVGSDFHLTPLSREEVDAYLETRIAIAGGKRRLFTDAAVDAIAEQSRGVPRVINIIADTALVYAFSAQENMVDAETVRNVVRDKSEYGVFGIAADRDMPMPKGSRGPQAPTPNRQAAAAANDGSREPETPPAADVVRRAPAAVSRAATRPAMAEPLASVATASPAARSDEAASFALRRARAESVEAVGKSDDAPRMRTRAAQPIELPPTAEDTRAATTAYPTPRAETVRKHVEPPPVVINPAPAPPPPVARTATNMPPQPAQAPAGAPVIGVVIVAQGEDRLALRGLDSKIQSVYVCESGDPGAAAARTAGAQVVEIADRTLSPGRARNAGYRHLKKVEPALAYVQFVEADVALDAGWLSVAARFMERRPEVAALEGRIAGRGTDRPRRAETGAPRDEETQCVGKNAFVRASAFEAAGGFRGDLPVNETQDLCIRLRRRGAHIWRLDAQMGARSAPTGGLGEWWRQRLAAGYEYAHGAALHGAPPERLYAGEQLRAVFWGALFPVLVLVAAIAGATLAAFYAPVTGAMPVAVGILLLGMLVYLGKMALTAISLGPARLESWSDAILTTIGHAPEFLGAWRFYSGGARARPLVRAAG
jgi:type II secretory pathway predicted ATPase ExeA